MKQQKHSNMKYRYFIKIKILILSVLCFSAASWAQIYTDYVDFNYNQINNIPPILLLPALNIPAYPNPSIQPLNHKIKSAKLYALLNLGDEYPLGSNNLGSGNSGVIFSADITLHIEGKKGTAAVIDLPNKQLKIDNSQPERLFFNDFTSDAQVITQFNITITNQAISSDAAVTTIVHDNLRLRVYYEIEYQVDVRASNLVPSPDITTLPANAAANKTKGRVQTFVWNGAAGSPAYKFPNYQFQLLRLYNIDESTDASQTSITAKIDWSKALTIETQSSENKLTLSIAEGTGFYAWRVRPIGTYYEGGIASYRNWGEWSNAPADDANPIPVNLSNLGGANNPFFYLEDGDEDINWIYTRTFTEGNKISEKISYANGLQQLRQTQAHLQTKNKTVVSQTVNDNSGRPALTTMPVPVDGGLNGYKTELVKTTSNKLYTADDYDKDANYKAPSTVKSTTGEAYHYYSDGNTDLSIPNAEGYPYTRNIYFNDGTNRVKEQSGVGKRHAIGEQTDEQGRTVRTFYDTPSEDELIQIFGDEAPAANTVFKTVTIDANNTTSVTYTSKEGKVIATCMAVNPDDDLLSPLDGENASNTPVVNSATQNVATPNGFVSTKRIAFSNSTLVNIGYKIKCEALNFCSGGGDCGYKVQVFIHDLERNTSYRSDVFDLNAVSCVDGYKAISAITNWTPAIAANTLEAGNYIIEKQLFSDPANQSTTVAGGLQNIETTIQPLIEVLVSWLNEVNNEQQLAAFYQKVQDFSDALEAAHLLFTGTNQEVYDNVRAYAPAILEGFIFDLSHHLKFDIKYEGTHPTKPKVEELEVSGGCCGTMKVPVSYVPPIECYTTQEIIDGGPPGTATSVSPDFEGYLLSVLIEKGFPPRFASIPGVLQGLLPGYNSGDFNLMIYHMLTDKYSCDAVSPATVQYDCKKLWKCWINVVSTYEDLLEMEGSDNSVKKGVGEEDGDDTYNDHFDNNAEDDGGGWLTDWLTQRALNRRVRDEDNGKSFKVNLAELFMQCAEYRFARIVEPASTMPYALLPYSSEALKRPLPEDEAEYSAHQNLTLNPYDATNFLYPYISVPVFAFKYFEYKSRVGQSEPDVLPGFIPKFLPSFGQLEVMNCYDGNIYPSPICNGPECNGESHLTWTCTERVIFYNSIKNVQPQEQEIEAEHQSCPTKQYLEEQLNILIDECNGTCDSRRNEFRQEVERMFLDNCYVIGGCPTNENVVTERDIDEITNALVQKCKDQCAEIKATAHATYDSRVNDYYPICVPDLVCNMYNGSTGFSQKIYNQVYLVPDCQKKRIQQVKYWRFRPALPTTQSKCDNPPPLPAWWNNFGFDECVSPPPSISKAYKVEVTVH